MTAMQQRRDKANRDASRMSETCNGCGKVYKTHGYEGRHECPACYKQRREVK